MKNAVIFKKNDVKIYAMKSQEGNDLVTNLVKNCVDLTLKKTKRDKIVRKLRNGLEDINKNHLEVYDEEVRHQIFFFMDNVFNQFNYKEIDIDELFC